MMHRQILALYFSALFTTSVYAAGEVVRMPPKQSDEDASHSYITAVLSLALKETESSYGASRIEYLPITYNQRLMFSLLNHKGVLDVVASAPSPEREIRYRSARVPLLKGLLGYRMMLIRKEDEEKFNNIKDPEELKQMVSCQGAHWPDREVFESNGYPVSAADDYFELFILLNSRQCDYFPRAVTEGYSELHAYNQMNSEQPLVAFDRIIFHYEQPFLFYTSHENFELAARLEKGLELAVESGKLVALMKNHPVTEHIFPISKWADKTYVKLDNPLMIGSLPYEDERYWLKLENQ